MWNNSNRDDLGNPRIDFVWGGTLPPAPADDRVGDGFIAPGDAESEFYLDGHATAAEWNGGVDAGYDNYYTDYMYPSLWMDGQGNNRIQLTAWNNYPNNLPNTGVNYTVENWNWLSGIDDAYLTPNVLGKTIEQANAELRNLGVADDVTREFLSENANPYNLSGINTNTGEGVKQFGNIIYRYVGANDQIPTFFGGFGQDLDGTDATGAEWNNKVIGMWNFPMTRVPIDAEDPGFLYGKWLAHTLIVCTTDSTKDQFGWWD